MKFAPVNFDSTVNTIDYCSSRCGIWIFDINLFADNIYHFEFLQEAGRQTTVEFYLENKKEKWFTSNRGIENFTYDPFSSALTHHWRQRIEYSGTYDCFIHLKFDVKPRNLNAEIKWEDFFHIQISHPNNNGSHIIDFTQLNGNGIYLITTNDNVNNDINISDSKNDNDNNDSNYSYISDLISLTKTMSYYNIPYQVVDISKIFKLEVKSKSCPKYTDYIFFGKIFHFHHNFENQFKNNFLLYLANFNKSVEFVESRDDDGVVDIIIWTGILSSDISTLDTLTCPITKLRSKNINWVNYFDAFSLSPEAYGQFLSFMFSKVTDNPKIEANELYRLAMFKTFDFYQGRNSLIFCNPGLLTFKNISNQGIHRNLRNDNYFINNLPNIEEENRVSVYLILDDHASPGNIDKASASASVIDNASASVIDNASASVDRAIKNITDQTYPNIEIVILDFENILKCKTIREKYKFNLLVKIPTIDPSLTRLENLCHILHQNHNVLDKESEPSSKYAMFNMVQMVSESDRISAQLKYLILQKLQENRLDNIDDIDNIDNVNCENKKKIQIVSCERGLLEGKDVSEVYENKIKNQINGHELAIYDTSLFKDIKGGDSDGSGDSRSLKKYNYSELMLEFFNLLLTSMKVKNHLKDDYISFSQYPFFTTIPRVLVKF